MIFGIRKRWSAERFEREAKSLLAPLYRMALRLTGQRPDAEDLVHDAIVKAYQSYDRSTFDGPDGMRAWMFRILANTFRDRYRRSCRSPEVSFSDLNSDPESNVIDLIPSAEPSPAHQAERRQVLEAIQAATDRLSPQIRLAVTLFFVEGCSYQEIADIAGCPIGTVMSRLSSGRRALRQELAHLSDRAVATPAQARPRKVYARQGDEGGAS